MKKIVCIVLALMFLLVSCDTVTPDTFLNSDTKSTTSSQANGNDDGGDGVSDNDNSKVQMVKCLTTLLSEYQLNPVSALPDTMVIESESHLINPSDIITDYSQNVSVQNIPQNGFGEQWNMVAENIYEYEKFFNTFLIIDGLTTISIAGFNNYLDQKPEDEAVYYTFNEGIYSVVIRCTETTVFYVLDYQFELPNVGVQNIQIALSMDMNSSSKSARIQVGDLASLAYDLTDKGYKFALDIVGSRQAYFEINEHENGSHSGYICEYLTVGGYELSESVADFYITEDYVTVVGNKADGILAFDGYICELYSTATGKMLGYEIRESLSAAGADAVTYNTLWVNLEYISGINSIKHAMVDSDDNEYAFFVNGSSKEWSTKKYGLSGGLKLASRRFDIEFRTQYCYSYDEANDTYVKQEMSVPMLFVQEEVLSSLVDDVRETNNISISLTLSENVLTKLINEYSSKVDVLIEHKNKYSADLIRELIGDRITFN